MKRSILVLVLFLAPTMAWCEYNPEKIKSEIDAQHDMFGVSGWKQSENGRAWIAVGNVKSQTLSVGQDNAGIIAVLGSSDQSINALIRCMALASIGLNPQTERERARISTVIRDASKGKSGVVAGDGMTFKASAMQLGSSVVFSCVLTSSQ